MTRPKGAVDQPLLNPVWLPTTNYSPWRPGNPVAIVIHTEAGTQEATAQWFHNPASQVSAHYAVGLDGQLLQFVDLEHQAWANGILEAGNRWQQLGLPGNPNGWTVSIETEDRGDPNQEVTAKQYVGVVSACRLALARYPGIQWLVSHRDISPRSRPACPGARWWASGRMEALCALLGLRGLP